MEVGGRGLAVTIRAPQPPAGRPGRPSAPVRTAVDAVERSFRPDPGPPLERMQMSESKELSGLTLKELRRLASERSIPNRSRLSKQELIAALGGDAPAEREPEVLSPETVGAAPAAKREERSDSGPAGEGKDDEKKEEGASGGRRRRRRRRRRRGRDDREDGERRDEPGRSTAPEPPKAEKVDGAPKGEKTPDRKRGESGRGPQGSEASRLAGDQPSLGSVLERLRALAGGVLELCDPDTPGWAQARLSELLSGAGVVPIPCRGRPHPDYHEVDGTAPSDVTPEGEIALIEAPGFALRGDRGDLFPLRKARVRIAGDGKSAAGRKPADRENLAKNDGGPREPKAAEEDAASPGKKPAAEPEAPVAVAEPTARAERDAEPEPVEKPEPEPERKRNRNRNRDRRRSSSADDGPPPPAQHEDRAPHLPLEPQEAEELAERPKAEGFRPLGLNEQILADLAAIRYKEPTPIQGEAIPVALSGRDLIGQAQTGTGKTAAFVLPILDNLYRWEGDGPVALTLCPTRELARQVHAEAVKMAGRSGARATVIYGGVSYDDQIAALARRPHLVVGTPGRIIDHIKRRRLDCSRVQVLILDEADQMLDIGFLPDIEFIIKQTPPARQTMLFSATMPEPIRKLSEKYMRDPFTVDVMPETATVSEVDQKYIAVDYDKKTALLAHFIETQEPEQLVVFCRTKHQTDRVAKVLKQKRMKASAIHGDMPQSKREKTLRDFRAGELQCLIATNVAARGLDIPTVSHVVNYDVPETPEEYVHRVGRTARNGADGVARTFITPEDGQFLLEIEKHIGLLLDEEVVEGMRASTATQVQRKIADTQVKGPRLIKPLMTGIRLGRRRR